MRVPALNRLLLPGSSGDFPPILHQYTSAIRPDDETRAIHWITFYAYYAFCAVREMLPFSVWCANHSTPQRLRSHLSATKRSDHSSRPLGSLYEPFRGSKVV